MDYYYINAWLSLLTSIPKSFIPFLMFMFITTKYISLKKHCQHLMLISDINSLIRSSSAKLRFRCCYEWHVWRWATKSFSSTAVVRRLVEKWVFLVRTTSENAKTWYCIASCNTCSALLSRAYVCDNNIGAT